jgi:DNA polymerase III subunit gamma/tau
MVDLTFRKLLGHRVAWASALALLVAALWIPAGAQAATAVPGVPSPDAALSDVPATAQAAVGAALAQAGAGTVDRPSVATVPTPLPSAPPVSSPSAPPSAPVVTGSALHLSVAASASPASAAPIPDPAPVVPNGVGVALSAPGPDPAASAARQPTGGVSDSDVRRARPSGQLSAAHRSLGRGVAVVAPRPIEIISAAREPVAAGGWPRLARTHRVAPAPVVVAAPHRAHRQSSGVTAASTTAASAIAPVSPPVPASLPPGGTGGAGAGAGAGPAGAAALALLVLAGIALLRSILPGLMTLDLLPWRSAVVGMQLERPG